MNRHITVMLKETIDALQVRKGGTYVDCTLGSGGHARAILQNGGSLICLDKDAEACDSFFKSRDAEVHNFSFARIGEAVSTRAVDGVLFDLGISQNQMEDSSRGFSFKLDGPIDMRMDCTKGKTALDVIRNYTLEELSFILREYSDEKFHRRIASLIKGNVDHLKTSIQLACLIEKNIGWKKKGKHPATKTFQAIRMAVNDEMKELSIGMAEAFKILKPRGRLVIITFHATEDRAVKKFMMSQVKGKNIAHFKALGRARWISSLTASQDELKLNTRASSARLRCIEKL